MEWTLDELVAIAGHVLMGSATAGCYAGPPNGRVRELPDQRVIRWYASLGLVDRPAGGRGRGARYGRRHLRQLVAVKQLQGQGLALAEIQARLAGIGDAELERLAPLPSGELVPGVPVDSSYSASRRFWAADASSPHATGHRAMSTPPADGGGLPGVESLTGVRLAPGVLLLLSLVPGPDDLAALAEAAGPLVTTLTARGLIPAPAPSVGPTQGAS